MSASIEILFDLTVGDTTLMDGKYDQSYLIFQLTAPGGSLFSSPDFPELGTFDLGAVASDSYGGIERYIQHEDGSFTDQAEANFIFTPTTLTVSAVPEATSWTLLIAGLGATGAALRSDALRSQPDRRMNASRRVSATGTGFVQTVRRG